MGILRVGNMGNMIICSYMSNILGNHPNLILKVMEIETEQVGKPCVVAHDELNLVSII